MVEHPCAGGLSGACFKAYPAWARQAFAYKLLHIMLPKQLSRDLPRGLNLALVPPGVILPPGVVLPPGTIVPPGVTFPPGWTPGDPAPPGVVIPPGTTFPPGWTPGDPTPPGVVIPPGTIFPPGWTPPDPAPPGVQLPPSVSPVPPDSGALPPIYVQPWEPGPIKGPGGIIPSGEIEETPIYIQGPGDGERLFGGDDITYKLAGSILDSFSANISRIEIKIGKYGSPTDQVWLEIREKGLDGLPGDIIFGGVSSPNLPSLVKPFSIDMDYLSFSFLDEPVIYSWSSYFIVLANGISYDYDNCYKVVDFLDPGGEMYYQRVDETWSNLISESLDFKVYGTLI